MTFQKGNQEFRKAHLKAEKALKAQLKKGGLTECGAYVKMMDIWSAVIDRACEGYVPAAQLVIERLDGKPKQQIDANINVNHAFEQALIEGRSRVIEQDAISHQPSDPVPSCIDVQDTCALEVEYRQESEGENLNK